MFSILHLMCVSTQPPMTGQRNCVSTLNTVPHWAEPDQGPQNVQGRVSKASTKALEPLNTPPFCQNCLQICDFCQQEILVSFHKLLFSTP